MTFRSFLHPVFALIVSWPVLLSGAEGVALRLRDPITGYAIVGTVTIQGAEEGQFGRVVLSTDESGFAQYELPPGQYLVEVSAPDYRRGRSHFFVRPDVVLPLKFMLGREYPPLEYRSDSFDDKLRPGFTHVHGFIVDAETGRPLPGAEVTTRRTQVRTSSDAGGYFEVSAPTKGRGGPDQAPPTDDLIVRMQGYQTEIMSNFWLPDGQDEGFTVELKKGTGVEEHDLTHRLQRDAVVPEGPQAPRSGRESALSPLVREWLYGPIDAPKRKLLKRLALGSREVSQVVPLQLVLPSTIRVGMNCSCNDCTEVEIYDLEEYVKEGLGDEWISWWHVESLKAGAVAYRSYGAYHVNNPVRPNYDICSSPCCQAFDPSGNPPKKITDAVDATATVVLSDDGVNPFFAEYAAEGNLASSANAVCPDGQVGEPDSSWPCMEDFVCTGKQQASTHSRGMCQRGSQRWASGKDDTGAGGDTGAVLTTPRDWRCILDHYYNANSNDIQVDPSGNGLAGTEERTAFLENALPAGIISYQDHSTSPTSLRTAGAADGGADTLLVEPGLQSSWAPDEDKLVYRSGTGLAVVNADGSGQMQITFNSGLNQFGQTKLDFNPAWSPLGDRIAFCSTRTGPKVDVWTVKPNGTDLLQVTTGLLDYAMGTGPQPCYLSWSPNGAKIAFTGHTATGPWPLLRYDIYVMNADGSAVTQLTQCIESSGTWQSACINPDWSPDGSKIVFENQNFQGDNYGGAGIYTVNANGSGVVPVFLSSSTINSWRYCQKLWTEDQAARSGTITPSLNFFPSRT